jgi:hypothetical protein
MSGVNLHTNFFAATNDLFGWAGFSLIFLPFGLWSARRNPKGLLIGSVIISLVVVYLTYWIGSSLFGPRYYYEGLYSLTLFSAAGIAWLARWPLQRGEHFIRYEDWRKLRPLSVTFVLGVLLAINIALYLPIRLHAMYGLYGIERADQTPFQTPAAQSLTPALVIVHADRWMEYGALLDLEDPELTTPFIFAWNSGALDDDTLGEDFPDRTVYQYYPEQPFKLYKQTLPDQ